MLFLSGEIDTELGFLIQAGIKPSAQQLSELLSAKILDRLDSVTSYDQDNTKCHSYLNAFYSGLTDTLIW